MSKVIITGANGFVGYNLVSLFLEKGYSVYAVIHERAERLYAINNSNLHIIKNNELNNCFSDLKIELMYNLAWNGSGGGLRADPYLQLDNIKQTIAFYELAQKLDCKKFISIGTIGEKMASSLNSTDTDSQNCIYVNAKNFTHRLLKILSNKSTCKVVWAVLGGIYGEGDSTNNLINYTLKSIQNNKVPEFGPCEQYFDFIHVSDCVMALYLLGVEDLISNEFYIGSGNPRRLKDFLLPIPKIVNSKINLGIGKKPDDGTRYSKEWFDITTLEKETGYQAAIDFEEGIYKTYNWLRKNIVEI